MSFRASNAEIDGIPSIKARPAMSHERVGVQALDLKRRYNDRSMN